MITRLNWIASPVLLLALLSSCSLTSNQSQSNATVGQSGHSDASQMSNWQLIGKLGFKTESAGGSASIQWIQREDDYKISLRGPFSTGFATIVGNQQVAELKTGDQIYRQPPEQLLANLTGLSIPITQLQHWLKGLPMTEEPKATAITHNADGTMARFTQDEWQISLSNYQQTDAGKLPKKIVGQKDNVNFKFVISRWITGL
jgi:outer membrane lipoprotein LolB